MVVMAILAYDQVSVKVNWMASFRARAMPVKSECRISVPPEEADMTPALVIVLEPFAVIVPTKRFWFEAGWDRVATTRASEASVERTVSVLAAVPAPVPQAR
jgi:hypothetical protein